MRANPVMSADLRAAFDRTGELHTVAAFLAALAAVLYAWWPRSDLAWHLRTATPPQTFAAVSIAVFLLAGYLNARAGTGGHAAPGEATLADLVALTPVSVASVVAGRMAAAILVALFHLLLALPFLVAALGVSGVPASVLPATAAVIAAAAMAWRAAALALRLALPEHPILRDVLLLAASATWLAASYVVAPVINPLTALVDLASGGHRALEVAGVSLPFFAVSAIIAVLVIAVAGVASWAALRAARAAAGRRASLPGKGHDRDGSGPQG